MCKYCEEKTEVIGNYNTDIGKIEVFLEDSELTINSYEISNHTEIISSDISICDSIKINYCPMCGRKL